MSAGVSAVVRTYNSAGTLDACLDSLREQSLPVHVVVVDSGSTDDTVAIAGRRADELVSIPHEEFTYGRALNLGAAAAGGAVQVALSSHCVLPRADWVEIAAGHLDDDTVAGVTGRTFAPDGTPMSAPLAVTSTTATTNPFYCFSNHASAWRRDVWERFRFNEDLEASEDAEWSDRVVAAGFTVLFDPELFVSGLHRSAHGYAALYQRRKRETRALARVRKNVLMTAPQLIERWWRVPANWDRGALRARLNRERIATALADWSVGRELRHEAVDGVPSDVRACS